MSERSVALGGPVFTRTFKFLATLFVLGCALILWRLVAGLGATTAMNDGEPWGIWIAFDVVTGTALACGGYAMAILVYVLNRGKYHPLVRSAILTSALGYTMAGVSITLDVGRPWLIWKVPTYFWSWNFHSALLEVALCVMSYIFVLWIELSPAFFEKFAEGPEGGLKRFSKKILPVLDKSLIWIIALGMLLPTMHQSSLGSLVMLLSQKVYPLWQTPFLPLLFLTSCIAMGYAAVVFESTLSGIFFRRPRETAMLAGLGKAMLPILLFFLVLRFGDLAYHGKLPLLFVPNRFTLLFWIETVLFALPLVLLSSDRLRSNAANLFRAAMSLMLAGGLYRFDAYLIAYRPGEDVHYFPSTQETLITLGLVALEILVYITFVKLFPILSGAPRRATAQA